MLVVGLLLSGIAMIHSQVSDSLVFSKKVDSLILVTINLSGKAEYEKALEINSTAETLALNHFGRMSESYSLCCHNHGRILYSGRRLDEVEKWYLEAKSIREQITGRENADYASIMNNLANLYMDLGLYESAEQHYIESKNIRERVLGKLHADYASSLNNLGNLYNLKGRYPEAESNYIEAKNIRLMSLGKNHSDYAASLLNLGLLYSEMGELEKVEILYKDALLIFEKSLGKKHPNYALCLNNLAIFYMDMAQYDKAETYYTESITIRKEVLGGDHPDYAGSLINLAILYWRMGQDEKSEKLYLQAKDILEKASHGRNHPYYQNCLNNLALLYSDMGHYLKAESIYIEIQKFRALHQDTTHPDYAETIVNLAILYWRMNDFITAESLYLKAISILKAILGTENSTYANALNSLAILYMDQHKYQKAENLLSEARHTLKKTIGPINVEYTICLKDLAELYIKIGSPDNAESVLLELSEINKVLATRSLYHLSEQELSKYLSEFSESQNQILDFVQSFGSQKLSSICFDNALFYKGFLLQSTGRIKQLSNLTASSREEFNHWKGLNRRLAILYSSPLDERDTTLIHQLEENTELVEKNLTRTVAGWGEAKRQVSLNDIQAKLKKDEAAIEFVHYLKSNQANSDSTQYVALITKAGTKFSSLVPLFNEWQLKELLSKISIGNDANTNLYIRRGATPEKIQTIVNLYELIWKPLEPFLKGVGRIYFSPTGYLHRINLGAIPCNAKETFADRYLLVGLNSTRHLVIPESTNFEGNNAVLYGGLHFKKDSSQNVTNTTLDNTSLGEFNFNFTEKSLRGNNWEYLEGTKMEIKSIGQIMKASGMQVTVLSTNEGTEESFKELGIIKKSPRVLHIATHGYFFPDLHHKSSQSELTRKVREPVFKISEHPMMRSGLILSGGNEGWKGDKTLEGREDGVLTAYEISQMNLSNTELVVLSACETGLGDIQGNEGVYGLQRAFKIAGAKHIIMSLWQVPDKQTSLLMTAFYKKWLEENMTIPDAFHLAQKQLRGEGLEPYYWAGFVLVE